MPYDGGMKHGLALAMFCLGILSLPAAMRMEKVEYKAGDTICEGMVVYDDAFKSRRSGIIIAHQWKGLTAYERMRAELLAVRGHVVMCADVYGKGRRNDREMDYCEGRPPLCTGIEAQRCIEISSRRADGERHEHGLGRRLESARSPP